MTQSPRHIGSFLTLALLAFVCTGCADAITYSRDSQRAGKKLFAAGNYADAAGAFKNSVRQVPTNYESYYYLGASYEKLQQYQQAIAAYKTARQTIALTVEGRSDDETKQKILNGIASTIASSDPRNIELDSAQQDAETKGTADNWFILAKVYALRGDPDSAIDAYNRAALLEPNNFFVAKDFGLYLDRIGQTDRAQATLRRAYSLNNQDSEVTLALRKMGVITGPSLAAETGFGSPTPAESRTNSSNGSVAAPRD